MCKLSLDRVALDSTTIRARKEELVGYDGYKMVKKMKIHVLSSREAYH